MTAYILNLIDLAFTLHALSHGASELNPAMGCVPIMIVYKVFVVGALIRWLSGRSERIARVGLRACTVAYAAANLWHIYSIFGGAFA